MIQIKKESINKTYKEKYILIEIMKQFHYSTEKEKLEHSELMQADGFTDAGQTRTNIGTLTQPKYAWVGNYYKHKIKNKH